MTYEKAMEFLRYSNQLGSVLGLESIKELLKRLDNPQDKLKFIHIGGTNGKGSTAAYITYILGEAGYQVGRFTSPYVFKEEEIIQISYKKSDQIIHEYINKEDLTLCIKKIQHACQTMVRDGLSHPTTFEIETAMAMLYFYMKNCDIVVLEVGLGGRLDATNVIKSPECVVMTTIGMDHTQFLGNTLEEIAKEKSGIIKEKIPVVSYEQEDRVKEIIKEACIKECSPLYMADFKSFKIEKIQLMGTRFSFQGIKKYYKSMEITMLGINQVKNAILAALTMEVLNQKGYNITNKNIREGLLHAKWKGRFDVIQTNPTILVDGAHNENASKSLAENIELYFKNKEIIYIVGILEDKDYRKIISNTYSFAKEIITITPNNKRALSSTKLAKLAKEYTRNVIDGKDLASGLRIAKEHSSKDTVIVIFGSLSFLKQVHQEKVI